jgi:hypothetical protein
MNNPIKIIWKIKNKNKRITYHTYIFIGNLPNTNNKIFKILQKIQNKSLYDSLILLSLNEITSLETFYGQKWYSFFFNSYHINHIKYIVKNIQIQKKELINKFGENWFNTHISSVDIVEKKIIYSYETLIKNVYDRLEKKKKSATGVDEIENTNFKTIAKKNITKIIKASFIPKLHKPQINKTNNRDLDTTDNNDLDTTDNNDLDTTDNNDLDTTDNNDLDTTDNNDLDTTDNNDLLKQFGGDEEILEQNIKNVEDSVIFDEELKDVSTEEELIELDDIVKLFNISDQEIDEKSKETRVLIAKALGDNTDINTIELGIIKYNDQYDSTIYDHKLQEVYIKYYITNNYINFDDTIITIKNKICASIGLNFNNSYLLPSRQYLWSEYYYNNIIEKIMIGQKWLRHNDILDIDIQPNNKLRIYEELEGILRQLKNNLNRFGSKIRREDDDSNILENYQDYIMNNEIYMIDIYNEIGKNYNPSPEVLNNLFDVYIKIYFPKIVLDDFLLILKFLNNTDTSDSEVNKMKQTYLTINNDLIMENKIMNIVNNIKVNQLEIKKIFKQSYITNSTIHLYLRLLEDTQVDLFRIFDEFVLDDTYPFIQYQTYNGKIVFKFLEDNITKFSRDHNNKNILAKWFENAPFGISFKVKTDNNKFMAIKLSNNKLIEYKTQWKEEDKATYENINKTYNYILHLINKLNTEKNQIKIDIPDSSEFNYAFINTMQKFNLGVDSTKKKKDYIINHNDLSDFARFFYPYVSVVIDPKKRESKIKKDIIYSKSGTYLRYNRISKFHNRSKIELRVIYFIRNYEYNENNLSDEISKQFNITIEKATEIIVDVIKKNPRLKKSRKLLKKFENIPKSKPPGIEIDIQGKTADSYKIRISGARSIKQLNNITCFVNILLFLYKETYLIKNPDYQHIKNILKQLTNIAKRRHKVLEIVIRDDNDINIKKITKKDKRRLGFTPEKGQNQWSRSCQNSGNKNRQPREPYISSNLDEMLKDGYALNKKTGIYEKKVIVHKNGIKDEIKIRTVNVREYDEEGNQTGNDLHYTCDPKKNQEYMYVGFLTKSKNPFGECMPCCFKKNQATSSNKTKKQFFENCLNKKKILDKSTAEMSISKSNTPLGEKIYILQDTNKLQAGRISFLPKYLDVFLNTMLNNKYIIHQNYLTNTNTGYYFKYGTNQDSNQFINCISNIFNLTLDEIKHKIINILNKDKDNRIFISLDNGDLQARFNNKQNYIDYINNDNFDYELLYHILSLPKVLSKFGTNIIIFSKKLSIIKKELDKDIITEDYVINCTDTEDKYSIFNPLMDNIILINDYKRYYPVVLLTKENNNITITNKFKFDAMHKLNMINHISEFYIKSCISNKISHIISKKQIQTAKDVKFILSKYSDIDIKYQIIDARFKCKYLITNNDIIIPVNNSGALFDISIIKNFENYYHNFIDTLNNCNKLNSKVDNQIKIKPIGIYYNDIKNDSSNIEITAIYVQNKLTIPIIPEIKLKNDIIQLHLLLFKNTIYDKLDKEILKGSNNITIDNRITQINKDNFETESYNLFRLEFSKYINNPENGNFRAKLEKIILKNDLSISDKIFKIKLLLYKLIDNNLYKLFTEEQNKLNNTNYDTDLVHNNNTNNYNNTHNTDNTSNYQYGGTTYNNFINVSNKSKIDYSKDEYAIANNRTICQEFNYYDNSKELCDANQHCKFINNKCLFTTTKSLVIQFINSISNELGRNDFKAFEIRQIGNYFVSDIVDLNNFSHRDGQKVIRSDNSKINDLLSQLFGSHKPIIGKKRFKQDISFIDQLNKDNPLIDIGNMYIQNIIHNNISIFRTFANSYYWINNPIYNTSIRNLGYYSENQTNIANYFKSEFINWLDNLDNIKLIQLNKIINKYFLNKINFKQLQLDTINNPENITNGIIELFILNQLYKIPIVIYDKNNHIALFFSNKLYDSNFPQDILTHNPNYINIKYTMDNNLFIPDNIESLYVK